MKRIESLLIVQKGPKIILGLKRPEKKFGGKWNGFGGGQEKGESLEECAVRETQSETGIIPKDLTKRGIVLCRFETGEQDHEVHIYRAENYEGDLNTSGDFLEYREFSEEELKKIYDKMMPADKYWIPFFIQGKRFRGRVDFDLEFKNPRAYIYEVQSLI